MLTHDTKFDVPAILGALRTRVGYLGAMGSRRTHERRWERLLEAGADEAELNERLMSPIGLDIGARTPEETAVAICAEIIAVRTGRADGVRHPAAQRGGRHSPELTAPPRHVARRAAAARALRCLGCLLLR